MPIDINKHEVDIDTLFKQNELDLCSIKELYRKLKELEKKIIQIKYIDSNLADKLKKDYEKLKRIILDENIQLQLANKINEVNSQLVTITKQRLTTITPQMFGCVGDGITDDTLNFQNCINYAIQNKSLITSDRNKIYKLSNELLINGVVNID